MAFSFNWKLTSVNFRLPNTFAVPTHLNPNDEEKPHFKKDKRQCQCSPSVLINYKSLRNNVIYIFLLRHIINKKKNPDRFNWNFLFFLIHWSSFYSVQKLYDSFQTEGDCCWAETTIWKVFLLLDLTPMPLFPPSHPSPPSHNLGLCEYVFDFCKINLIY